MISIPHMPQAKQFHVGGAASDSLQLIGRTVPMRQLPSPRANRVLASIPSVEFDRIVAEFDSVNLLAGEVLYELGRKPRYAYFPTTAIVSLMCEAADGASSEICAVGNDGVAGFELFTGGDTACSRAVVTSAGHAYRFEVRRLKCELGRTTLLISAVLRYTQALIAHIAQVALCNRRHSVEQQLCRRLLFSLDHLPAGELLLTHGQIADLLGVRRESITAAAGRLQSAGVIRYFRGRIQVLDRAGLESRACGCYGRVNQQWERLVSVGPRVVKQAA